MEAPPYLGILLSQDFGRACSKQMYCFRCAGGFCLHCCRSHAGGHHPGEQRLRIAEVRSVRHGMCISAEDVNGVKYDWKGIQRLRNGGKKFIPLRRFGVLPQHGMPLNCINCGDPTYTKRDYCCTGCKKEHVDGGKGRDVIEALLATDFVQQTPMDVFCTGCRRLFTSTCCPEHLLAHHPPNTAARLVRVMRHGGWVVTPSIDLVGLPQEALNQIQVIEVGGLVTVPICRSEEQLGGEAGNLCFSCFKVIDAEFSYCSLQCGGDDMLFGA
ncbi:hypothetical protein EJB05_32640 [Eragrostis curvula]|uniref:Uncharacterized protein n=1 Tax=Eragrostis curvula TaxID=38414 RepID=A0A5J9UGM8_9POAL|nr:hypothetical protein EJB05_32640 [Eragrostis curvula]